MNLYFFGNMINYASLVMIAACANCFSLKNSQMNLGGEAQIYAGGFVASIACTFFWNKGFSPVSILLAAAFFAGFAGFISAFLSGLFKYFKNVPELLTSFLFSAGTIPLIDGLIAGKFRIKEGNLLATEFLAENLRLKKLLPPSCFNVTFFWGIFFCLAAAFLIFRTNFGRRLEIYGKAREFSISSGFSRFFWETVPFSISGFFHGLTGFFATAGTYYTCHSGFYAGMGWNALSICLIAKSNPIIVIPVSLAYSLLYSLGTQSSLAGTTGFDLPSLIQGAALISIAVIYRTSAEKNS